MWQEHVCSQYLYPPHQHNRTFIHLDYDALVVKAALEGPGLDEEEIKQHIDYVYAGRSSDAMWSSAQKVLVDWPFCGPRHAENLLAFGRDSKRKTICHFFTVSASEAWRRCLSQHVTKEFNAVTVFVDKKEDVATALKPFFKQFIGAHQAMPTAVEKIFPQADAAFLWDNNQSPFNPILVARCSKAKPIKIINPELWDRFQYKKEINFSEAAFEVVDRYEKEGKTKFHVRYSDLIIRGREIEKFHPHL